MRRNVYFISDSTGITAETLGQSFLAQFPQYDFEKETIPYVNSIEKAEEALHEINNGERAIVFSTLAKPEIREIFTNCNAFFIDFFAMLMPALEDELKTGYAQKIGELHAIKNLATYDRRITALDFALNTDDGIATKDYKKADIILLGVSRSGKTPTSLYMALKFGIFAANYPLTEDDLELGQLPIALENYQEKLFGLTIKPERLQEIRQQRKPDSKYASLQQCEKEQAAIKHLFASYKIPSLDSTAFSIEELATRIMALKKLKRN